jgi:hypothetical protein
MSFGFATRQDAIAKAIDQASIARQRKIVFFAAAANDGANKAELFPAYLSSVISVRGTNHYGSFVDSYNPPPVATNVSSALFGTLGLDVQYDFPSLDTKSGCSIATPIMAAMVSLVLQLGDSCKMEDESLAKLHTLEGVQMLLRDIAVDQGNNRYFVHLRSLFDGRPNWQRNWVKRIEVAMDKLPK